MRLVLFSAYVCIEKKEDANHIHLSTNQFLNAPEFNTNFVQMHQFFIVAVALDANNTK